MAVTPAAEVKAVAARLRATQPAWQAMGVEGRAEWLGKWRDWILDHTDELLSMVQRETGKSWGDTAGSEALVPQLINYWTDNAAEFLADENVRPVGAANAAKKLTIAYEPYQLVGVITPWNGPLSVPMLDIPAALMAGFRKSDPFPGRGMLKRLAIPSRSHPHRERYWWPLSHVPLDPSRTWVNFVVSQWLSKRSDQPNRLKPSPADSPDSDLVVTTL